MRYLPAITIWTLTLAALALAALVLVGCGDQGESELTDTFAVGQRPRVTIESFGGTIEVRAGADGVVRVDSTLRNPQRIDFAASGTQDEVSVRARRADGISIGNFPAGVAMVVTVPAAADLDVTALNGEIHLSGVDGDTALRTSNGPVTVAESSGDLVVTVGTGAIRMVAFTGQAVLNLHWLHHSHRCRRYVQLHSIEWEHQFRRLVHPWQHECLPHQQWLGERGGF